MQPQDAFAIILVLIDLALATTLSQWATLHTLDVNVPGAPAWFLERPRYWIRAQLIFGMALVLFAFLVMSETAVLTVGLACAIGFYFAPIMGKRRAFGTYRAYFRELTEAAEGGSVTLPEPVAPYSRIAANEPELRRGAAHYATTHAGMTNAELEAVIEFRQSKKADADGT